MRKVVFVLLVLFVFSCSEKNKVSVERIFPEEIDINTQFTCVNDSIQLIVKTKDSDTDYVTFSRLSGDTIWEDKYRDKIVELNLSLNESNVFSKSFEKHVLIETMPKEFMSSAHIIGVWYDSFNSETEEVKLQMTVCKPETDYCYRYNIYITVTGTFKIELEEIN